MPFDGSGPFDPPGSDLNVLRRARTRIAFSWNWGQGQYATSYGQVCAVAAVAMAMSDGRNTGLILTSDMHRVVRRLSREIPHTRWVLWTLGQLLRHKRRVMTFNDSKRTTHAMIVKLFDDAIQRLERKQARYQPVLAGR